MKEADIGMTEHRSKNTLGRSVPIKTKTDVEEEGTSEDGSPRPVCIFIIGLVGYSILYSKFVGLHFLQGHGLKYTLSQINDRPTLCQYYFL